MENAREHRDIKLVRIERRANYLVSEPNYLTTKFFTEHLLEIEMKKLSKILMYEFWYDYVNQNIMKKQNGVIWIQTFSLYT